MYSREDKLRAVELLIKYDFSPQSVIDESGTVKALALQLVRGVTRKRWRHSRRQPLPALRRGPEARCR